MILNPAKLLLALPRLIVGARRYTLPREFDARKVLQPGDFAVTETVGGRRVVQDLLDHLRMLSSRTLAALGEGSAVAICSPGREEGRSLTAVNLAATMAHDTGREIVLVDADLRNPILHELLDIPDGPGLTDIGSRGEFDHLLCPTDHHGLYLLRAGSPPEDPVPLLQDGRIEHVVAKLAERGALAVFDTPPANHVIDTRLVAERVHGVITVVKLCHTRRSVLADYYRKLERVPFLGVACNYDEDWLPPWLARFL